MRLRSLAPGALLLLMAIGSSATAGVVMEFETRDIGSDAAGPAHRLLAQGEMLRIESTDPARGLVMIFRDDTMFLLDPGPKKYYRLDPKSLEAIGAQIHDAMAQMEAQLAGLPPEQRASVEKMMKGRFPGLGEPPEITVEREGSETVGKWTCSKYGVYEGGTKTSEVFTAPSSDLDGVGEALDSFRAFARFSEKVLESLPAGAMGGMLQNPLRMMDQMEGVPVLTRRFEGGRASQETSLKSVTRQDLAADLFQPPPGYKQADLGKLAR